MIADYFCRLSFFNCELELIFSFRLVIDKLSPLSFVILHYESNANQNLQWQRWTDTNESFFQKKLDSLFAGSIGFSHLHDLSVFLWCNAGSEKFCLASCDSFFIRPYNNYGSTNGNNCSFHFLFPLDKPFGFTNKPCGHT